MMGNDMDDLILQGGIIAGTQQDIVIDRGRIRQITPHASIPAQKTLNITGKLVLAGNDVLCGSG